MKKLIRTLWLMGLLPVAAAAWNPVTDVRDNWQWTFGKTAEAGLAVKLAGAGDLDRGDTATNALAGIASYRFFVFSYGGIMVNKNDSKPTDTFKIGLSLQEFFGWFKNPPTPEMAILKNVNVGPAIAMPVISRSHPVTLFLQANYQFGGNQ